MAERAESPSGSARKQQVSRRAQKLSDERLARKRELDRQAQRSARVKTKNHIAYLESRIEALTKVQGNGDVRELIEQIEEQRKEIETLKTTLKTIGKLVGHTGDNGTVVPAKSEVEGEKAQLAGHNSPDTDGTTSDRTEDIRSGSIDMGGPSNSNAMILSNNGIEMDLSQSDIHIFTEALFPGYKEKTPPYFALHPNPVTLENFNIPSAGSLVHNQSMFGNSSMMQADWRSNPSECCCRTIIMGNNLLANCSKLRLNNVANQRTHDQDIAIRVVLHGWNAVTERYSLDPVWQTVRQADTAMFSKCFSLTERLVCLHGVCVQLRAQTTPTTENIGLLPLFAYERPSQRSIPHHSLIDYLVWPGLRERLVFNPHCYCSDKFEGLFWPCFRFVWEHEFSDMYHFNRQNGLFQFTAPFLEQVRDVRSYRMAQKFFNVFPELRVDIEVVDEPVPSPGSDRALGFGPTLPQDVEILTNPYIEGVVGLTWQSSEHESR